MTDEEHEADDAEVSNSQRDELTRLYERDGKLTAEQVVRAARSKRSPLHERFEWDDKTAAHEWRLERARLMIRSVTIMIDEHPVRAFPFLASAGSYAPIRDVMANADYRQELVDRFHRDAESFEARWRHHQAVADAYAEWAGAQVAS